MVSHILTALFALFSSDVFSIACALKIRNELLQFIKGNFLVQADMKTQLSDLPVAILIVFGNQLRNGDLGTITCEEMERFLDNPTDDVST
jgi:hypothetical protein